MPRTLTAKEKGEADLLATELEGDITHSSLNEQTVHKLRLLAIHKFEMPYFPPRTKSKAVLVEAILERATQAPPAGGAADDADGDDEMAAPDEEEIDPEAHAAEEDVEPEEDAAEEEIDPEEDAEEGETDSEETAEDDDDQDDEDAARELVDAANRAHLQNIAKFTPKAIELLQRHEAACAVYLVNGLMSRVHHRIGVSHMHDNIPAYRAYLHAQLHGDMEPLRHFLKGSPRGDDAARFAGNSHAATKMLRHIFSDFNPKNATAQEIADKVDDWINAESSEEDDVEGEEGEEGEGEGED